jgi:hypothetical protein
MAKMAEAEQAKEKSKAKLLEQRERAKALLKHHHVSL